MDRIHVLLLDQDPLWKTDVELCLKTEPDLVLIGAVRTKEEAIQAVSLLPVHVILMDVFCRKPSAAGMEAVLEIGRMEKAKVIMLTDEEKEDCIVEAMGHLTYNYIVKTHLQDIPDAIRAAYCDYSPLHPSSACAIRNEMARMMQMRWRQQLTEAETTILHMVAQGFTQQQMSERLFISESTVKKHVNRIIRKFETKTSKEAARKASLRGII